MCKISVLNDVRERELVKKSKHPVVFLISLACILYLLSGCTHGTSHHMGSLKKPWVKRGERLIHPDNTIIRFEKPRYYKGRLSGKRKNDFYEKVTPEKLLASWGVNGSSPAVMKFSKRWEPRNSGGRLHKFTIEMDYYTFSSADAFNAGEKMTTKRVVIYRYMGANITNRMGIGIIGYSDRVLAHLREFDDLVGSMSF
jgi:hypothetical protein